MGVGGGKGRAGGGAWDRGNKGLVLTVDLLIYLLFTHDLLTYFRANLLPCFLTSLLACLLACLFAYVLSFTEGL